MNEALLVIFVGTCVGLLAWGMRERDRIYQFPFLVGATFLAFIVPQLIGSLKDLTLPGGSLAKVLTMSIFCAGCCWMGYRCSFNVPRLLPQCEFSQGKLLGFATALSAVGAYFFFLLSRMKEELEGVSQWSGLAVAYLFFAQLLAYGFAITLLIFFRTGSLYALGLALFGSLFYLDRIFIAGRRGVALEFGFIILLSAWFGRRWSLPRGVMLAGILVGSLLVHSIGAYREITQSQQTLQWSQIWKIPYLETVGAVLEEGSFEIRNAAHMIEATDQTKTFDYGLFHWNTLVFNYIPAQVLGDAFKESLMIELPDNAFNVFGWTPHPGSTNTGMVDAFESFWYFGALKFFLIALILSRLYHSAICGNWTAQLFYMLILMPALHTITHHTHWFVSPWVHMFVFLVPGLVWAMRRPGATREECHPPEEVPALIKSRGLQ